jgi:hypothetical protein
MSLFRNRAEPRPRTVEESEDAVPHFSLRFSYHCLTSSSLRSDFAFFTAFQCHQKDWFVVCAVAMLQKSVFVVGGLCHDTPISPLFLRSLRALTCGWAQYNC